MNSCIFRANVMHDRTFPKRNRFRYRIYTFCLDLDELDRLDSELRFFGSERRAVFKFSKDDHLDYGKVSLRENLLEYLLQNGVSGPFKRILLITNIRVLGYVFNPVSFYFLYEESDRPVCAVAEVGNTFGERKPYFLGRTAWDDGVFRMRTGKFFYVSPFLDLRSEFEFALGLPDEALRIRIDAFENGEKVMTTAYTGSRIPLTDFNLFLMFFSYPLVTLRVIVLIHWQAFKLYLKGLPFIRKNENTDLQQGVHFGKNHRFERKNQGA
ncbi:DUF1365 domain-containing protein [Leptospira ellisii]|uniref:DUF1365 domain-containing protein n=1 Tax=Leptospira ellisii TaxID=2023197 RepID=A0AAE4QP19_9LEPT|nr:DUF1365 domain-containing protein [Leptospira ellisii]MDV6236320.1 DUF1365 domain-containing protein [Leptospira ellisii]